MIVGVGGQGSLLASKLLGHVMLKKGVDVKVSEVHGMSQRGGSVVTYVRFGDKVYSPIIDKGEADYIISFETLEAARYMANLKPGGQVIVNDQQMDLLLFEDRNRLRRLICLADFVPLLRQVNLNRVRDLFLVIAY